MNEMKWINKHKNNPRRNTRWSTRWRSWARPCQAAARCRSRRKQLMGWWTTRVDALWCTLGCAGDRIVLTLFLLIVSTKPNSVIKNKTLFEKDRFWIPLSKRKLFLKKTERKKTVFLLIVNQSEFRYQKENCRYDHIPFNLRIIRNLLLWVSLHVIWVGQLNRSLELWRHTVLLLMALYCKQSSKIA